MILRRVAPFTPIYAERARLNSSAKGAYSSRRMTHSATLAVNSRFCPPFLISKAHLLCLKHLRRLKRQRLRTRRP